MLLTKKEFTKQIKNNKLKIAFIGMSNTGKSFRSNELHQIKKFNYLHVDDAIEKELNLGSMAKMAEWMGHPFNSRYKLRSKKYLELEEKYTTHNQFLHKERNNNFVLDTTGSVIYLSNKTKQYLQENYLLILLDIPPEKVDDMKKLFFQEPKSVYWGDSFQQLENEIEIDALKRCYPKLLQDRQSLYRGLADIIIPGEISQYKGLSIHRFLEIISFALPNKK